MMTKQEKIELLEAATGKKNYFIEGYEEKFYEYYLFLEEIKSKYGLEGIRKIYKVLNEEFAEIFRLVSYMSEVDYEQF